LRHECVPTVILGIIKTCISYHQTEERISYAQSLIANASFNDAKTNSWEAYVTQLSLCTIDNEFSGRSYIFMDDQSTNTIVVQDAMNESEMISFLELREE
jgi:hypothetical protein